MFISVVRLVFDQMFSSESKHTVSNQSSLWSERRRLWFKKKKHKSVKSNDCELKDAF